MLRHTDIWAAIDRLAQEHGLTASGLARRSGLDPTTFNKSKRITREGKPRWPSTESVAKILGATGTTFDDFVALLSTNGKVTEPPSLPLVGSDAVRSVDGQLRGLPSRLPNGGAIVFPELGASTFAIAVNDRQWEPAYRQGDILIVAQAQHLRRGDRVLVRTKAGEMLPAEVVRPGRRLVVQPLGRPAGEVRTLAASEPSWLVRILWVSQ